MPAILALAATTVAGCTASPTFSAAMVALANSPAASICCLVKVVIEAGACGSVCTQYGLFLVWDIQRANGQFRRTRSLFPPHRGAEPRTFRPRDVGQIPDLPPPFRGHIFQ